MVADLTPTELARTIGSQYVNDEIHSSDSETVRLAYREIVKVNEKKFEKLLRSDVDVVFTEDDPYDSYEDMKESVEETGVFKVFSGGSCAEYMSWSETCIHRAVHDWFGHLDADCDFSFLGEFQKWDHVKDDYPKRAHNVLFADIVGQVSAAYYLEDGFDSPNFKQRSISAPQVWIEQTRDMFEREEGR